MSKIISDNFYNIVTKPDYILQLIIYFLDKGIALNLFKCVCIGIKVRMKNNNFIIIFLLILSIILIISCNSDQVSISFITTSSGTDHRGFYIVDDDIDNRVYFDTNDTVYNSGYYDYAKIVNADKQIEISVSADTSTGNATYLSIRIYKNDELVLKSVQTTSPITFLEGIYSFSDDGDTSSE